MNEAKKSKKSSFHVTHLPSSDPRVSSVLWTLKVNCKLCLNWAFPVDGLGPFLKRNPETPHVLYLPRTWLGSAATILLWRISQAYQTLSLLSYFGHSAFDDNHDKLLISLFCILVNNFLFKLCCGVDGSKELWIGPEDVSCGHLFWLQGLAVWTKFAFGHPAACNLRSRVNA